jgi:hypothetical protein
MILYFIFVWIFVFHVFHVPLGCHVSTTICYVYVYDYVYNIYILLFYIILYYIIYIILYYVYVCILCPIYNIYNIINTLYKCIHTPTNLIGVYIPFLLFCRLENQPRIEVHSFTHFYFR